MTINTQSLLFYLLGTMTLELINILKKYWYHNNR